jgi:hypothetical protein
MEPGCRRTVSVRWKVDDMLKKIATAAVARGRALDVRRLLRPGAPGSRRVRTARTRTAAWLRRLASQSKGSRYRLTRGHPAGDVDSKTLADRIRSTIGPIEKRLGLPRVHVMVENHTALLHGEVRTQSDVQVLEQAVSSVWGVDGVESHLRVGLLPGEDRAPAGRQAPTPS